MKISSLALTVLVAAAARARGADSAGFALPRLSRLFLIVLAAASNGENVAEAAPGDCFDPDGENLKAALQTFIIEGCSSNATCNTVATWGPIGRWCTSAVTRMEYMFANIPNGLARTFNEDISTWDISNVQSLFRFFEGASSFNRDLDSWNTSSVTNMGSVFSGASAFNGRISTWDLSKTNDTLKMFYYARSFNRDISAWDMSGVKDMTRMFLGARAFNQDISSWNVQEVTSLASTFQDTWAFNQDISGWNVSKVDNMRWTFEGAKAFNQNLCPWRNTFNDIGFQGVTIFGEGETPRYWSRVQQIFDNSGCVNNSTPTSPDDAWCQEPCAGYTPRPSPAIISSPTVATNPSPTIPSPTTSTSKFRWYPDWNGANTGCIADGKHPEYMDVNPIFFLFKNKQECCLTHYSWGFKGCMGADLLPMATGKFYPDWGSGKSLGCLADKGDTLAPDYMRMASMWYFHDTIEKCCDEHYKWTKKACMKYSDPDYNGSGKYYPVFGTLGERTMCKKDCKVGPGCGGLADTNNLFWTTKYEDCCKWNTIQRDWYLCLEEHPDPKMRPAWVDKGGYVKGTWPCGSSPCGVTAYCCPHTNFKKCTIGSTGIIQCHN